MRALKKLLLKDENVVGGAPLSRTKFLNKKISRKKYLLQMLSPQKKLKENAGAEEEENLNQ